MYILGFSILLLVVGQLHKNCSKLLSKIFLKVKAFHGTNMEILIFLNFYIKMAEMLPFVWSSMSESTTQGFVKPIKFCAFSSLHTIPHISPWAIKH